MIASTVPAEVNWDITYACPLRCTHCYSESGRRPSDQLSHDDMLRVADAIVEMRPGWVAMAGGEPLVVPGLFDIVERIGRAGIQMNLYTSGWSLKPSMIDDMTRLFARINVSIDGATAEVHDRIRGRAGSFDRAMEVLRLLDDAAARRVAAGEEPTPFGIDCSVVRSAFDQLSDFCTNIAPRFPHLGFLWFAAAMPIGLASREGFAEHELLTDAQAAELATAPFAHRLQQLAPPSVAVSIADCRMMLLHPDERGQAPFMQVGPDGTVRAIPIYEGTVGNLLEEPGTLIWQRCLERYRHPFISRALGDARTMQGWADATRSIDLYFGTAQDRDRIGRRPPFSMPQSILEGR